MIKYECRYSVGQRVRFVCQRDKETERTGIVHAVAPSAGIYQIRADDGPRVFVSLREFEILGEVQP